jgi:hypothetical protein
MAIADEAARVPRPEQAKVYADTLAAAASVTYTVKTSWQGGYMTFVMIGDEARIAFSEGTATALTLNSNSSTSTDPQVLTAVADTGWPLVDGVPQSFIIGTADSTFEIVAGGTGGTWFAYQSHGEGE